MKLKPQSIWYDKYIKFKQLAQERPAQATRLNSLALTYKSMLWQPSKSLWFDMREHKATELIDRALLMAKFTQGTDRFGAYVAITNRLITYRLNLTERRK